MRAGEVLRERDRQRIKNKRVESQLRNKALREEEREYRKKKNEEYRKREGEFEDRKRARDRSRREKYYGKSDDEVTRRKDKKKKKKSSAGGGGGDDGDDDDTDDPDDKPGGYVSDDGLRWRRKGEFDELMSDVTSESEPGSEDDDEESHSGSDGDDDYDWGVKTGSQSTTIDFPAMPGPAEVRSWWKQSLRLIAKSCPQSDRAFRWAREVARKKTTFEELKHTRGMSHLDAIIAGEIMKIVRSPLKEKIDLQDDRAHEQGYQLGDIRPALPVSETEDESSGTDCFLSEVISKAPSKVQDQIKDLKSNKNGTAGLKIKDKFHCRTENQRSRTEIIHR